MLSHIFHMASAVLHMPFLLKLNIVNVAKTLAQGVSQYETGKRKLMTAIRMYDQSLMDLTVSLLAGMAMVGDTRLTHHRQTYGG